MKKALQFSIIGLFCLQIQNNLQAQKYVSFPDSGGNWSETYWWQPSPFFYNGIGDTYIEGDTVFNDTVYKKIYNLRRDIFCSDIIIQGSEYNGAIREDTMNQKVYYKGTINASEQLLYDYSLEIGDTLQTNWYSPYYGVYVTSIDTLTTLDGVQRRIWHLDCVTPFDGWPQIIEGIGSTSGFCGGIEPYWEGWNELLCFSIDGEVVWRGIRDTCYVITDSCATVGNIELCQQNTIIHFYPNPVRKSTIFNVKISQLQSPKNYFAIYDLYGKEILFSEIHNNHFTVKSPANRGIYIVRVIANDQFLAFKLIVSN